MLCFKKKNYIFVSCIETWKTNSHLRHFVIPSSVSLLHGFELLQGHADADPLAYAEGGADGGGGSSEIINRQAQDYVDERLLEFQQQIQQLQGEYWLLLLI